MIIVSLAAALGAAGALLTVLGLRPRPVELTPRRATRPPALPAAVAGVITALLVGLLLRWPAVAIAAGVLAATAPRLIEQAKHRAPATHDLAEAAARWAEMLRDLLPSGAGIEDALRTVATGAPTVIRDELAALAHRMDAVPVADALEEFASNAPDPTMRFVARALSAASTHPAGRLAETLSSLAVVARERARAEMRISAAFDRLRANGRYISLFAVLYTAALFVFDRNFFAVYRTATGQLVLLGAFSAGATAITILQHAGRPRRTQGRTP